MVLVVYADNPLPGGRIHLHMQIILSHEVAYIGPIGPISAHTMGRAPPYSPIALLCVPGVGTRCLVPGTWCHNDAAPTTQARSATPSFMERPNIPLRGHPPHSDIGTLYTGTLYNRMAGTLYGSS